MASTDRDATVAGLVGGIVGDVQTLMRQELALARQETREELEKARQAAIAMGSAVALLGVGALLLVLMLAQGLADLLDWPVWAGYGLVGAALAIVGVVLFSGAKKRAKDIHPVPDKTVATMKENMEWIRDRTTSVTT